jgi:hypothetical protein
VFPFVLQEFAMSSSIPRRVFMMALASGGAVLAGAARAQTMADEKDPQSAALGYVADAKRVDAKKFPKYAAGQLCSNCALYQGKATDKAAACPLFAGKQVAGPGWCNAWAKKG